MSLELQKKVTEYINSLKAAPSQKSQEWYLLKAKTIGGSEVATVLGVNPFRSVKSLVAEKAGVSDCPFKGNIATRWGNLFEAITREWTEKVLCMEECIQETGSIEGIIDRQRYSPDGIGVVQLMNCNDELDYYIVLFEFKSPLRSLPDGRIPKYYSPQIQTGMLTIPIIELSIFVNNCYRKCSLKDIGFDMTYDTKFHKADLTKKRSKTQHFTEVMACGLHCFYQTAEQYNRSIKACGYGSESDCDENDTKNEASALTESNEPRKPNDIIDDIFDAARFDDSDMYILMTSREQTIDFGKSVEKTIDRLLELLEEKRICHKAFPLILNSAAVNEMDFIQTHQKERKESTDNPAAIIHGYMEQFRKECDDQNCYVIGYLPWKLLKSDIIMETAKPNWRETIEPCIVDILGKIDAITASDDPKAKFSELYPSAVEDDIECFTMDDVGLKKTQS